MRHPVYCRICGNEDNLAYCSQCGLPFDHAAESTLQLFRSRVEMLVQPIFHFLVTWFLLVIAPRAFFQSLMTNGQPVNASLIVTRRSQLSAFSPWLRPMTPVGYFAFGGLAFSIAGEYFDIFDSMMGLINSHTVAKSTDVVSSIFHTLFFEAIWCSVLVALIAPYKAILGIPRCHSGDAMEYCLYVVIQYWICSFGAVATAVLLDQYELLPAAGFVVLLAFMLALSIYYFVILPVIFLRPQFRVGIVRILCSCATMCVGQIVLLVMCLYIWLWQLPPLDFGVR